MCMWIYTVTTSGLLQTFNRDNELISINSLIRINHPFTVLATLQGLKDLAKQIKRIVGSKGIAY